MKTWCSLCKGKGEMPWLDGTIIECIQCQGIGVDDWPTGDMEIDAYMESEDLEPEVRRASEDRNQ